MPTQATGCHSILLYKVFYDTQGRHLKPVATSSFDNVIAGKETPTAMLNIIT